MPDQRQHRGPHPQDQKLFAADVVPRLRDAASDLSWLLTRQYATPSALKLIGDRYTLNARQRTAVGRCACADQKLTRRREHEVQPEDLEGQELWIDGYNVLTTLEAALSGGVILHARDGCYRDMASMHGSYRKVAETIPAIKIVGESLSALNVACCRWLLDQPVSNSGRLKTILKNAADENSWPWDVELVPDPDPILGCANQVVASADSQILDRASRWFNLAKVAVESSVQASWTIDLSC